MTANPLTERAREVIADWHRKKGCSQQVIDDCMSGNITIPEFYMELLEAALRLPAGVEWMPIETAPKDGTKILIWRDGWDFAPVAWRDVIDAEDGVFGAWAFDDCLCLGVSDGVLGWNEDVEDGDMPTHWQPLPAAPRQGPDGGEGV